MDSVDERVALLEGRIEEQSMGIDDVREAVRSLEIRLDRRLEQLESRLDQRFASVDQRFASIDERFASIDSRFLGIEGRLGRMETLLWGLILAFVSTALAAVAVLAQR